MAARRRSTEAGSANVQTAPAAIASARVGGLSQSLRDRMATINEKIAPNLVTRASSMPAANFSPFGILPLDMALCGGLAEGFAAMMFGFDSSGKTLVALKAAAGYQKKHPDKFVIFCDAEKLYDSAWAERVGVDLERMLVITPDTGEQAIDALIPLLGELDVGLVILDSVPACVPKSMAERSAEDKTMGALAALMGILCSKIVVSWGEERRRGHFVSVILLNQWRMKVGFVLGDPRTLPGGRQINHLPTTKIGLAKAYVADDENKEAGKKKKSKSTIKQSAEISFKIEKRKHGAGIDAGAFTIITAGNHESGLPPGSVDDAPSVIVYAIKFGLVAGRYKIPHFTEDEFAKKEDMVAWARKGGRAVTLLRATLIAASRAANGLPPFPPDDSLEGVDNISLHVPEDALAIAVQGATNSLLSFDGTGDEDAS